MHNIIGIDPGLAHCGWGVIKPAGRRANALSLLACGEIQTASNLSLAERLAKLHRELQEIFSHYQPASCAVECLYFNKNSSSAMAVAHARGVVLLCAAQQRSHVAEFSPNRIKQAVTGHGKAAKSQVQEMVTFLLRSDSAETIKNSDHAADALAAAICLVHHQGWDSGANSDRFLGV